MLLIAGCGRPPPSLEAELERATELRLVGALEEAGDLLDELIAGNPGNAVLVAERARVFDQAGDSEVAGFYFLEAARLAPEDVDLLMEARSILRISGDSSGELAIVQLMSIHAPAEMDAADWFLIGAAESEANRPRLALEAYQRGIRMSEEPVPALVALDMGSLFKQLENFAQAEIWYERAAGKGEGETQVQAELGLLDVYLRTGAWVRAETKMAEIDAIDSEAIDQSEFAEARTELRQWRQARRDLAELLRESAERPITAATDRSEVPEEDGIPEETSTEEGVDLAEVVPGPDGEDAVAPRSIKLSSADDALESETGEEVAVSDPVVVEPADEGFDLSVTFDGAQPGQITFGEPGSTPPPEIAIEEDTRDVDWTERATEAFERGETEDAVQLHWRALAGDPENARLWHQLSLVYLSLGESSNAETASLEAMRFAPRNVAYAIQHLRITQAFRRPGEWIREAEAIASRFPNHPDMLFNLARGYERIANDRELALTHYERFLEVRPDHPMAENARAAVQRLR